VTRFLDETEVVASVRGLTVTRLRAYVEARCVVPTEAGGRLAFGEVDIARLQLASELASDFDLDPETAGMVLSLIDQIHGLRHELRALTLAVEAEDASAVARIRARLAAGHHG